MSTPTIYLISGAGRGIGFSLVEQLSSRPNTVVFAGIRTFPAPAESQLALLAARLPEVVIPIKLTSADEADNKAAAEEIKGKFGKLDVVIANAGYSSGAADLLSTTADGLLEDVKINAMGPLLLFQKTVPLLSKSSVRKFIVISSQVGRIGQMGGGPLVPYGMSKAALNWVSKKIHEDFTPVICFPIHPGTVNTDGLREAAAVFGMPVQAFNPITPEQSAAGILDLVDGATRESRGGRFWQWDGKELGW